MVDRLVRESPGWNPSDYLRFEKERSLPCRELVARLELEHPRSLVDLGCGTGTSTRVLADRWPQARILGVDSSKEMLRAASSSEMHARWLLADIRDWRSEEPFDLVFSNAALQWVPNHESELPRLFGCVGDGGALAFQMPSGEGAWARALRDVAETPEWRGLLTENLIDLRTQTLEYYYSILSRVAKRVEIWETTYVHVLPGPASVVDWTKGTALRPILDRLSSSKTPVFLRDYLRAVEQAYPRQDDGTVLFPFLRRFVVAYR